MSITSGFHITGRLFDPQRVVLKEAIFHIYGQDNEFLTYGKTDDAGKFDVSIHGSKDSQISLLFRQCQERFVVDDDPVLQKHENLKCNLSFLRDRKEIADKSAVITLSEKVVSVGDIYFERNIHSESVPLSYLIDVGVAGLKAQVRGFLETVKDKLDCAGRRTIESVVDGFGCPHTALTGETTWDLITNGICPHYLKQKGDFLLAEISWDNYEFDKLQSLPNVKAWFTTKTTGKPRLEKIDLSFRSKLETGEQKEALVEKSYTPDSPDFQEAIRACNSAFHIYGQTVYHLGLGHVYGMQVAMGAHDFLQHHKLGALLLPHCKFIKKISNELGKTAIFGDKGILNDSALSPVGIAHLISDTLSSVDPFSFKPREPVGDTHLFAKGQKIHYDLLVKAVDEYFESNWSEMEADWEPVHQFFRRMFRRSPLYRPWNGEKLATAGWQDAQEIGADTKGLPQRKKCLPDDDAVRSFRPIATDPKKPKVKDRELIQKFCVHFIHLVTFWHSWIHRSQYTKTDAAPAVTDVNFAPITLSQQGHAPFGGISHAEAYNQLVLGATFKHFPVQSYALLDNKDVFVGIRNRMQAAASAYKAVGINPLEEIQFSTVI